MMQSQKNIIHAEINNVAVFDKTLFPQKTPHCIALIYAAGTCKGV